MRKISEQELKDILDKHGKWLRNEEGGEKADLSYTDLRSANLRSANLSYADLSSADLRSANLSWANLSWANLELADLSWANLSSANLSSANLLIFQFNRDQAFFTLDGMLRIGCIFMPISEWLIGYEEIAKAHKYSEIETKAYGDFIKYCAKTFEKWNG